MSIRVLSRLVFICLLLGAGLLPAQEETRYAPRPGVAIPPAALETGYQNRPVRNLPPVAPVELFESKETRYNPAGTSSRLPIGLISTRRSSAEFPGFLLGMQDASVQHRAHPLNVAPLTEQSLADQANFLGRHGVKAILVDSPDPAQAREFIEKAAMLNQKVVLLGDEIPRGFFPPAVIDSPILYGEAIGEAAINLVGNNEVEVGYILAGDIEPETRKAILSTFQKPFANVAPKIRLREVNPFTKDALPPPAAVCALTEKDSTKFAAILRTRYPGAKVIVTGETPEVISAFEGKLADVRIRPDYDRLFLAALAESEKKSEMPIVLRPATERHFDEK